MRESASQKPPRRSSTLKVEGPWESAVGRALSKKRPAGGWPRAENPTKARRKKAVRRKPPQK